LIPLPDMEFCARQLPDYDPWRDSAGYRFNSDSAQAACDWFGLHLSHYKGPKARQAFRLQLWQLAIIANLFGWVAAADETIRRYNESLVMVARKNGKTPLAAGVLLYLLYDDPLGDLGREIIGAAAEYGQACLVFDHAAGMVEQSEHLRARTGKLHRGQKKLIELDESTNRSAYRPVCAKSDNLHGLNCNAVVVDELHTQPNSELVEVLMSSVSGRRNPLTLHITTADWDRPSICNSKQRHAERVMDGTITDPNFLPAIWTSDPAAPLDDPGTWLDANPNLGVSKSVAYMAQRAQRAADDPTTELNFRRLDLNQRTKVEDQWLLVDRWDGCTYHADLWRDRLGVPCVAALDLSSWSDFTACAMVFGDWSILIRYWIPRATAERRQRQTNVPYMTWAAAGHITLVEGEEIDYGQIRDDVLVLAEQFPFLSLAIDRRFQGAQIARELYDAGLSVTAFDQTARAYNAPTLEFVRRMNCGGLTQDGSPVTRWMVANCAKTEDSSGNVRPSKKASLDKIDGVVAAIMATAFVATVEDGGATGAPLAAV